MIYQNHCKYIAVPCVFVMSVRYPSLSLWKGNQQRNEENCVFPTSFKHKKILKFQYPVCLCRGILLVFFFFFPLLCACICIHWLDTQKKKKEVSIAATEKTDLCLDTELGIGKVRNSIIKSNPESILSSFLHAINVVQQHVGHSVSSLLA